MPRRHTRQMHQNKPIASKRAGNAAKAIDVPIADGS